MHAGYQCIKEIEQPDILEPLLTYQVWHFLLQKTPYTNMFSLNSILTAIKKYIIFMC